MATTARVITVSTRAAAGVWRDIAGPPLAQVLHGTGMAVDDVVVVSDGEAVETALRDAVAAGVALVLTTGGTGCSPTDRTPEMTRRVVDREIPGIAELLRADGLARGVATAVLSRGTAGIVGATVVVNLPGSPAGAAEGLDALLAVLPHLLDQVAGEDHPR